VSCVHRSGYGVRDPDELTEEEIDDLVDEWQPESLIPPGSGSFVPAHTPVVERHEADGKRVLLEGDSQPKLNMASNNFLGLASHPDIKRVAIDTLEEYSCGSCGPRGFYGTTDKHVELEASIARFMGVSDAICYSGACLRVGVAAASCYTRVPSELLPRTPWCRLTLFTALQPRCLVARQWRARVSL
jgi:hypothetical protein